MATPQNSTRSPSALTALPQPYRNRYFTSGKYSFPFLPLSFPFFPPLLNPILTVTVTLLYPGWFSSIATMLVICFLVIEYQEANPTKLLLALQCRHVDMWLSYLVLFVTVDLTFDACTWYELRIHAVLAHGRRYMKYAMFGTFTGVVNVPDTESDRNLIKLQATCNYSLSSRTKLGYRGNLTVPETIRSTILLNLTLAFKVKFTRRNTYWRDAKYRIGKYSTSLHLSRAFPYYQYPQKFNS